MTYLPSGSAAKGQNDLLVYAQHPPSEGAGQGKQGAQNKKNIGGGGLFLKQKFNYNQAKGFSRPQSPPRSPNKTQ